MKRTVRKPSRRVAPRRVAPRRGAAHSLYLLRLYVSGATPRSLRAIANIKRICEEYLPGKFELDVIDIYKDPGLGTSEQIIASPTLIKKSPLPVRRFIGDLSETDRILLGLNLSLEAPAGTKVKKRRRA